MKDLTGNKFACFTAIHELPRVIIGKNKRKKRRWRVVCDCGQEYSFLQDTLCSSSAAGCHKCSPRYRKHGFCKKHRLYSTWTTMKNRCNNPNNKDYIYYGERGIKVCEEWNEFPNFIKDMESTYVKGLTLDRIEVDKGYCKENCRWATNIEQANNKTSNIWLIYNSTKYNKTQFCTYLGISKAVLDNRLRKNKTTEEIVNEFRKI